MLSTTLRVLAGGVGRLRVAAAPPGTSRRPPDPERARRYNREKERLALAGLVLSWTLGALAILLRLPPRVRDRAFARAGRGAAGQSIAVAAMALLGWLASLPLSYYSGYVLEHRYELSNQTRRSWLWDQLKELLLGMAFQVPLALGVLRVIARWPRRWWLITTGVSVPFTVLLTQLAPVLIFPLFNRYEPLRDRELAERLKALAGRSGIEVAEVLQMDLSRQTRKANAFFAGLGRTRRIVLADTLLQSFTPEEIEVIVAHEIAHQAHRDLWRFIALGTVFVATLSVTVDRLARWAIRRYRRRLDIPSLADVAALSLLGWLLSVVGLLLVPAQNAYSRAIERRADDYALRLTRDPQAFDSAMARLAELNLADPNPPWYIRYTLYSHPPIEERRDYARRFAERHGLPSRPES